MTAGIKGSTEWQLDRTGEFIVNTHGQYHCGTADRLNVRYNLSVVTSGDSLDSRGFLFDQTQIQRRMDAMAHTHLSCERFAHYTAQAIWKQIRDENGGLNIRSFSLSLSPSPFQATITFRWKAA